MLRSKDSFDNNPHFFVKKGFTGLNNLFDKHDTEKGKIIWKHWKHSTASGKTSYFCNNVNDIYVQCGWNTQNLFQGY